MSNEELLNFENIYKHDSTVIKNILREAGIRHYDPNVINQLLQYSSKYAAMVLGNASAYCRHAYREDIDESDIKLALTIEPNQSNVISREEINEIVCELNSKPLPDVKPNGIYLPSGSLSETNFKIKNKSKEIDESEMAILNLSKSESPISKSVIIRRPNPLPVIRTVPMTSVIRRPNIISASNFFQPTFQPRMEITNVDTKRKRDDNEQVIRIKIDPAKLKVDDDVIELN